MEAKGWFVMRRHTVGAIKYPKAGFQELWRLFLHGWYIDSIQEEHARAVKLSDSFHGGLFTAPAKFWAVLCVNT